MESPISGAQIRDCNRVMLMAWLKEHGAEPVGKLPIKCLHRRPRCCDQPPQQNATTDCCWTQPS